MSLFRIIPAAATLLAALPAAAHDIGISHSHPAMDSSLILGALLAVTGLGLWWVKNRG